MKQVTRDEFFKQINEQKLDVLPRIVTDKYPYTSNWEFRGSRALYGKTVGRTEAGCTVTDYFLAS
ncbi:hypothetical protein [Nitratireductor basaltis]|uniref:Uncharacterized protein n=1 Tax=Nitratireductor basaltis TaxID=472175 RepID=A0A084UDN0_9HYPH|nr:hypothetical protein [Nitratireductor basaltis]KFB11066.1 hypothetical protein EL18_02108 [Nitratireductor basaltis]